MITFEDNFVVNTSSENAYGYIINQEKLISLVPDLISHESVNENELKLTAKAGVSFIKGKFDLVLDISEKVENKFIKLTGKGNGSGASVDFNVEFNFENDGEGTKITWKADINVVGTAASMGARMMKSASQKYITKLVANYKAALEE